MAHELMSHNGQPLNSAQAAARAGEGVPSQVGEAFDVPCSSEGQDHLSVEFV